MRQVKRYKRDAIDNSFEANIYRDESGNTYVKINGKWFKVNYYTGYGWMTELGEVTDITSGRVS